MSNDDDALGKSTAELRAIPTKNLSHLQKISEGKETIHQVEEFVINVSVETSVERMTRLTSETYAYDDALLLATHKYWLHLFRSLTFRNSPVIIGGGVLGMIIGESANMPPLWQWVFIGAGLLLGICVYLIEDASGEYRA
jgi:hypothetical protein